MKIKKEYIILIAVIIILSLYLFMRNKNQTHYVLPEISKINGKDITQIDITKSDTTLILKKTGDEWQINQEGFPADEKKMKKMVDAIENLKLTDLVSESKNYTIYDLGDDIKISVKAYTGADLASEFDVGKTASSYSHTYVKLSDDTRVFLASNNFRNEFNQTVEKLRDKTVLSFETKDIQEMHITKDDKTIVLAQTQLPIEVTTDKAEAQKDQQPQKPPETVWQSPDGKKADESKVNNLLSTLSKLNCDKYIENKKKEDFTKPICTVLLKGPQEYTLSLFEKADKDDKDYMAISSANDYPFILKEWQANKIIKKPEELLIQPETEEKEKNVKKKP